MRDNPKANKILQKQLSAIGCTIQLDLEEEEAVVRGNIEKGPGGAFDGGAENWELQVDRTFKRIIETYTCHHVVEPKQIKKVLQDPFFASDDVKVYPESGYAVVVGESDVVKEKIAVLEKSIPIRIEEPVVEKRFKLIEEEFNREMRANCSEVKISRAANIIILEGPEDKVQSGAAKLNELIKTIKEKRVSLSNDLLDFMATSSVISKYQTLFQQSLRSPVSLEVGSGLVLSSLSSDALREAETAVLRDLNESSVTLQGAAAAAPDLNRLKESLDKAKNEENRGELRVNNSLLPGSSGTLSTKVKLVGYTEHVNKLKELLYDYQANQVSTPEVISLQCPELVDCFDKILEIIGMKQTEGVYLKKDHFGNLIVSSMKDGVNRTIVKVNSKLHGTLTREMRGREEDDLFARVMWCILRRNGNWERVPKTANYNLEMRDVAGGIMDAHGVLWQVDLRNLAVISAGHKTNLKRLENLEDFIFPLEWDSMAYGEDMKRVQLQPCTPEYRRVKQGFKRTANYTIIKIERVQNIHLRRAYEAQKKKIFEKNKQDGGANEKFLYHGTTEVNCDSIMKTGFNRRFCGLNATLYGEGTYFAVDASYSTNPTYSKPAADGSQLMFVARVLTGVYTLGQSGMKVPPPLDDQEPHIRYDSVVDKMDRPNMFVVFHDDQAYPDYLITFKQ
ncbi:uncharacterized protein LOC111611013 isoform X2 [Xiphophorus maculatus]|nr:uncharacterized protein LOC111611013 isoform X2 [Xiphophorus maculatus]